MALSRAFDKKTEMDERKFLRRMQSEIARREAAYVAGDELSLKVQEIKRQRQRDKEAAAAKAREDNSAQLLVDTRNPLAIERSNTKLHIPQMSRSLSKTTAQRRGQPRGSISRALSAVEAESESAAVSEGENESLAAKTTRAHARLPRSSSVDTYGRHCAVTPSDAEPWADSALPPLHDVDDLSEGSEEDEFAAAVLAEAKEEEALAAAARDRQGRVKHEHFVECPEATPFQAAAEVMTAASGVPVLPQYQDAGDVEYETLEYEENEDDEQYYMEEMSAVAADIVTDLMEDDLLDQLLEMAAASTTSEPSSSRNDPDVLSARVGPLTQPSTHRSDADLEEDMDVMGECVMDIVADDVVTSAIALAVIEEALYLSEFQELDSVGSEFSKYEKVEKVAARAPCSAVSPENTRLELERLQRFKDAVERKNTRDGSEATPMMYAISDNVQQPTYFPDLSDLFSMPYEDFLFNVPKTGNLLRVLIRHDDEGDRNGLFVHGFKPYSRAEEQGLLRVGDEVLAVNDINVQGQQLEAVIEALMNHEDEFVRIVIRRREDWRNDDISPRSNMSWNDHSISTQSSPRAFVVSDKVEQPDEFPDFSELFSFPSQDLLFRVPKTNGQLRVQLRYDDDGDAKGLFVHGFRPFSKAEEQGLLKIGDELIEVNDKHVEGAPLETVIEILMESEEEYVDMVIRRRDQLEEILKYAPYFSPRAGGVSPRGEHIGRDGIEAINDMQWEDIAIDSDSSVSALNIGESAFSVTSSIGSGVSGGIAAQDGYDSEIVKSRDSDSDSPRLEEVVDELDVLVPRTDGALRVLIRNIDGMANSGFYVHGFKPMCLAEGVLRAGDVILEINGSPINGLLLKDVAMILDSIKENNVSMKIRRSYVAKIRR